METYTFEFTKKEIQLIESFLFLQTIELEKQNSKYADEADRLTDIFSNALDEIRSKKK